MTFSNLINKDASFTAPVDVKAQNSFDKKHLLGLRDCSKR